MVREKHQDHCYHDAVAHGLIQTKLCGLGDWSLISQSLGLTLSPNIGLIFTPP